MWNFLRKAVFFAAAILFLAVIGAVVLTNRWIAQEIGPHREELTEDVLVTSAAADEPPRPSSAAVFPAPSSKKKIIYELPLDTDWVLQ